MIKYDVVIKNGTIIDPKRKKSTIANIGILNGKIREITREEMEGNAELDVSGKIVCPGIIDIHAHVEGDLDCARVLAAMGVTTVYNGNCGMSPENIKEFYNKYDSFLINQIEQIGHTTLREQVGVTDRYKSSSDEEIEKMKVILEESFEFGVSGLSFGLEYVPGSSRKEVLELAKVAAKYGKLVSIHIRSDSYGGLSSLREAIDITRKTGAAVNISHLTYQFGMGMATEALHIIEEALAEGLDISVDSGMYSGFATSIGSAVFDEGCIEKWGCDYSSLIAGTGKYKGKRLTKEMYEELRLNYPDDTVIGMVGEEYEVFEILEKPYVMVSTDAGTLYDAGVPGHPQDAGTYPKFFKTMVREQHRITLIDAIRRCTYMPAKRLGLINKGFIGVGADADILIFDAKIMEDRADYPCFGATDTRPEGIEYVFVNGVMTVKGKEVLYISAGKTIKDKCLMWNWGQ
ncbi:N-acyl-D-amino-acid deacylase [Clostridium beijerinckii]|uniref:N-acyl-D-amino-acid deacylase n=1 Tax=Clostridium beijerinckii TaxID=1520 RepID=A0A9Q5CZI5_CLOBE|nr:amidohydrolase family protein [Clostridium beijerinckii]AQS07804.1 N-acyl-D-glutamate deacylase [Clostridium beijerinckii]MBA2887295.1 N-acyl-D-amino-acid deacylase [Clostridium beijerinckii]MBA2902105.1 N-acyl-D-amino-acid deacylase [Clostridium beijerinckii]MBA2912008.1 N-acyl-D-amino-acid deacylase [Clostridium beijerinckii]MBA9017977.1 N-acyl-D-amino-acid deacylase [Clostridium beijerinckii]